MVSARYFIKEREGMDFLIQIFWILQEGHKTSCVMK